MLTKEKCIIRITKKGEIGIQIFQDRGDDTLLDALSHRSD